MGRLKLYVTGSAVMANIVLMRAYYERPNFYSAAVYISQSTGSLMFLVNLMLIVAASLGYGLQRLFYGPLRAIETEQLYDKAWFAVSETLLAMTIFRDDIGIWFFAMFLCLLAGKVWQWIGEGRVEFLEQQPPANPKLFHARLASSLLFSVGFDIFMMQYCIDSILSDARPGVMVMFGFEYVLLAIASISTSMRYTLSLVELYITHRQEKAREETRRLAREQAQQQATAAGTELPAQEDDDDEPDVPGWEEKGRWVFYLDLATDAIKSVVYLGFFMILMTFYGIPIHIMRDLFMTIRSFIKRCHDFIQYRNATRDMNTRYPDATTEELERENTCIVCREEMRPWSAPGADATQAGRRPDERQRPKKLPCGHILHASCLRSWLERQQVCPTCRRSVLTPAATSNPQPGNNQANPGPQPALGQQGNALQALLRDNFQQNAMPPPPALPPAPHQAQPGQQAQAGAAAQPNRPQGNMRVFNLGPIRIALGNLRVGPQDNVQNAVEQLRQQAMNPNQNANQAPQNPMSNQQFVQLPPMHTHLTPAPGAVALHPADIQSDILRIQQNIIESVRQLTAQHDQLELLHRTIAELHRIQQASGATAATGQELPHITPLNPQAMTNFIPQAYTAQGSTLRQGDTGLPQGLTLPEGWTLRSMAPIPRPGQDAPAASQPSNPSPSERAPEARSSDAGAPSTTSASVASVPTPASAPQSSPKAREPSSLESSWSFGNVPERIDAAEGSSSAVSGSSAEPPGQGQSVTRRTATVEDGDE